MELYVGGFGRSRLAPEGTKHPNSSESLLGASERYFQFLVTAEVPTFLPAAEDDLGMGQVSPCKPYKGPPVQGL